ITPERIADHAEVLDDFEIHVDRSGAARDCVCHGGGGQGVEHSKGAYQPGSLNVKQASAGMKVIRRFYNEMGEQMGNRRIRCAARRACTAAAIIELSGERCGRENHRSRHELLWVLYRHTDRPIFGCVVGEPELWLSRPDQADLKVR